MAGKNKSEEQLRDEQASRLGKSNGIVRMNRLMDDYIECLGDVRM